MRAPIRVTYDFENNLIQVEKGTMLSGLGLEETVVLARLEAELTERGYSDFATAEDMNSDARKEMMVKKKRYEELKERKDIPHTVWEPQPMPFTLFTIYQPGRGITFVEGMEEWMIEKMRELPTITINTVAQSVDKALNEPPEPDYEYKDQKEEPVLQGRTKAESRAIRVMLAAGVTDWDDKLTLREYQGNLIIMPKKFLADNWAPINTALKAEYGDKWVTRGKESAWEIPM